MHVKWILIDNYISRWLWNSELFYYNETSRVYRFGVAMEQRTGKTQASVYILTISAVSSTSAYRSFKRISWQTNRTVSSLAVHQEYIHIVPLRRINLTRYGWTRSKWFYIFMHFGISIRCLEVRRFMHWCVNYTQFHCTSLVIMKFKQLPET